MSFQGRWQGWGMRVYSAQYLEKVGYDHITDFERFNKNLALLKRAPFPLYPK
jgi:hypothetical protein